MSGITEDPNDPRLTHGGDTERTPQADVYLVASAEERAKGFVRPYRDTYKHTGGPNPCNTTTTMRTRALGETYAANPKFYGSTYCCYCERHLPVWHFNWIEADGSLGPTVGS